MIGTSHWIGALIFGGGILSALAISLFVHWLHTRRDQLSRRQVRQLEKQWERGR